MSLAVEWELNAMELAVELRVKGRVTPLVRTRWGGARYVLHSSSCACPTEEAFPTRQRAVGDTIFELAKTRWQESPLRPATAQLKALLEAAHRQWTAARSVGQQKDCGSQACGVGEDVRTLGLWLVVKLAYPQCSLRDLQQANVNFGDGVLHDLQRVSDALSYLHMTQKQCDVVPRERCPFQIAQWLNSPPPLGRGCAHPGLGGHRRDVHVHPRQQQTAQSCPFGQRHGVLSLPCPTSAA